MIRSDAWDESTDNDCTVDGVEVESADIEWFQAVVDEIESEIRVDEDGKGFASISATARICGVTQQSLSEGYRLKGGKLGKLLAAHGFDPTGWAVGGMPDVAMALIVQYYAYKAGRNCTAKAEIASDVLVSVGARVWMQKLKGWVEPVQQRQPQITEDHVRAVGFAEDKFAPFKSSHPIAADIFLHWQGVNVLTSNQFALPSGEIQSALNGAFLNLNRSGLAMNKLFHFIDRIPTMRTMDEDAVANLTDALTEAGRVIAKLQKDVEKLQADLVKSKGKVGDLEMQHNQVWNENRDLKQQVNELKRQLNVKQREKSRGGASLVSETYLLPNNSKQNPGLKSAD